MAPKLKLYTALVWHMSLKRQLRIAYLLDCRNPNKLGYVVLFSTDVDLDAELIYDYYKARFQIEFIFRDAKQFTGLCNCQSCDVQKLAFHFNASLSALNLAKYDAHRHHQAGSASEQPFVFSMSSYKRLAFNDDLLERFIAELDLEQTSIKSHPNYENLRSYGIITA